jgi:uncharacterized membrane protein
MRPLGVTLSAYFQFFRAALIALVAGGVMFVGGMASRLASLASEGNRLQEFLGSFGKFLGMVLLVYAGIQLVLGVGLLLRQNWARMATILFCVLGILLLLPRAAHLRPVSLIYTLVHLAVILYLLMPEARRYFEKKETGALTPA